MLDINLTLQIISQTHTESMAKQNSGDNPIYQSKQYSGGRPNYPEELFHFIASNTPSHELAWDAGTGTGQAACSVSPLSLSLSLPPFPVCILGLEF